MLYSFSSQDKVGKALFDHNCAGCHLPNKLKEFSPSQFAPSFQNIRKDYGLKWTVSFLQNNYKMLEKKDVRTLYSFYSFGKLKHISWPQLEQKYIVAILNYVDSYPADPTQYKHRLVSEAEKTSYVREQLLKDTIKEPVVLIDTSAYVEDTTTVELSRVGRRRAPPQKKQ